MSYKDLWSNTTPVLKQSEQHLVYFDNFVSAIENRIEVQENYASNLKQIAEKLQIQIGSKEEGSMIFVLSALKSDTIRRLNQTMIFANSLRTDVLNLIKEPYQKQVAEAARVRREILDLHAEHFNRWNTLGQSKRELKIFNKIREEQFVSLEIHKSKFFLNKSEEEKILPGVRKAEKQYQDAELRTKQTLKSYNSFIKDFDREIDKKLVILEQQQRERGTILLDSMKKILVFQVSMMRNFEYDVAGVSNHLASIEPQNDITELIRRNRTDVPRYPNQSLTKIGFMDASLHGMIKKTFQQKIKLNNDQSIQTFIMNLQKGPVKKESLDKKDYNYDEFTKVFKLILFSQTNTLEQEDIQQLNELLQKSSNRNFAQQAIKHLVKYKNYNNSNLVHLIELFIERCIVKRDVFCIRSIAKLILFELTPSKLKLKERQLYERLINLQVWRSYNFWNACLFEGIQEQLKMTHPLKNQEKKEAKARQRSIIMAQIEYWCVFMVMMGYQIIKIQQLAAKYSKFYNLNQKEYEYISKKILEGDKLYVKLSGENKKKQEKNVPSTLNSSLSK